MNTLVFVVAFCIVAVLVYMARYSGRLRVVHRRTIAAPPQAVYARVADFAQWGAWNPWLEHEPQAPVRVTGPGNTVGSELTWDSPRIGSGRITHLRLRSGALVEQRLSFRQPFRFRGRARWEFADRAGATEVTLSARARVAFAMRAFAPTVQGMIALDFRYGLDRLAATLEAAAARRYSIEYLGARDVPAARYACVAYRGPLDGLGAAVPAALAQLRRGLATAGVAATGDPVAIYVKTRVKLRTTECQIGLPVATAAATAPWTLRELPAHRAYVVRLHGNVQALEIAWYHAMQRMRIENIEPDLRITPFERYLDGAGTARAGAAGDATVDLHLAIRAPQPAAAQAR